MFEEWQKLVPRVTATIANDCSDYSRINGLQVFGEADKIVDATECEQSRRRLELRFRFVSDLGDAPGRLRDAYRRAEDSGGSTSSFCLDVNQLRKSP